MLYKSKPPTEFNGLSAFQAYLKEVRLEKQMSCVQMAMWLEVGVDTYKSWEYRGVKPNLDKLSVIFLKLKQVIS